MDIIQQLDGNILLWIQNYIRKEFLNPMILFITSLGDAGWFWILLLIGMLLSVKYRKIGMTGLVALLIGFLITNLCLKNMVARIRPYEVIEGLELIGKRAHDFSFPSGHSTCSMAASVVLFANSRIDVGSIYLFYQTLYWNPLSDGCLNRDVNWNNSGFGGNVYYKARKNRHPFVLKEEMSVFIY